MLRSLGSQLLHRSSALQSSRVFTTSAARFADSGEDAATASSKKRIEVRMMFEMNINPFHLGRFGARLIMST